jgi:hypothetical protein
LNEIGDAIKLVKDTKIAYPQMEETLKMFDETQQACHRKITVTSTG